MSKCIHGHDGTVAATAGADEVSSCCGAAVTYMDDGLDWVLACKCCYAAVEQAIERKVIVDTTTHEVTEAFSINFDDATAAIARIAERMGEWSAKDFTQMETHRGIAFTFTLLHHGKPVGLVEQSGMGGETTVFWQEGTSEVRATWLALIHDDYPDDLLEAVLLRSGLGQD